MGGPHSTNSAVHLNLPPLDLLRALRGHFFQPHPSKWGLSPNRQWPEIRTSLRLSKRRTTHHKRKRADITSSVPAASTPFSAQFTPRNTSSDHATGSDWHCRCQTQCQSSDRFGIGMLSPPPLPPQTRYDKQNHAQVCSSLNGLVRAVGAGLLAEQHRAPVPRCLALQSRSRL